MGSVYSHALYEWVPPACKCHMCVCLPLLLLPLVSAAAPPVAVSTSSLSLPDPSTSTTHSALTHKLISSLLGFAPEYTVSFAFCWHERVPPCERADCAHQASSHPAKEERRKEREDEGRRRRRRGRREDFLRAAWPSPASATPTTSTSIKQEIHTRTSNGDEARDPGTHKQTDRRLPCHLHRTGTAGAGCRGRSAEPRAGCYTPTAHPSLEGSR